MNFRKKIFCIASLEGSRWWCTPLEIEIPSPEKMSGVYNNSRLARTARTARPTVFASAAPWYKAMLELEKVTVGDLFYEHALSQKNSTTG